LSNSSAIFSIVADSSAISRSIRSIALAIFSYHHPLYRTKVLLYFKIGSKNINLKNEIFN
jgi:hypothetical protein